MTNLAKLKDLILQGRIKEVEELVKAAIYENVPARDILDNGLIAGMNVVGLKFKANEIFIPEVLIAAKAMSAGVKLLETLLIEQGCQPKGRIVIGTVRGDLHDIGKNIVGMMFKGAGFKIIDLGIDVPVEKFINAARENKAELVAMSALITTSMPVMKKVISALKQENILAKTMIGGAPVTGEFATQIGADGYAADAASAVDLAKSLLEN
ncbi:MAG: corrinoid protein [Candidatus Omnitrophota bacterium]